MDYSEMSDEQLMALFRDSDDRTAFAELYKRHKDRTYGRCLKATRHVQEAEDLNQEVWVKVCVYRDKYDGRYSFVGWLETIVSNTINDWFRKQKRKRKSLPETELGDAFERLLGVGPDSTREAREFWAHLYRRLSKKERHLVFLRFWKKLTQEETAAVLRRMYPGERWNPDKVRNLERKTLQKLARILREEGTGGFFETRAVAGAQLALPRPGPAAEELIYA